jgi:cell division protein FtsL
MWIIVTLMVLFFISTCALGFACYNMLKKIEVHEEWIEEYRTEIDKYRTEIENVYKRLKMVDDKNLFEKDDDVGFVFSEIQRVIQEFNDSIK